MCLLMLFVDLTERGQTKVTARRSSSNVATKMTHSIEKRKTSR